MDPQAEKEKDFKKIVWEYYRAHKRQMPWRTPLRRRGKEEYFDPYRIWISEVMLQQTQVDRVREKYQEFIKAFPTVNALAQVQLKDVLRVWQGLGYNRRARHVYEAAQRISGEWKGIFPRETERWDELPGIGKNTAGSICAFAFNTPQIFIETNIRSVFIHHFFNDRTDVSDAEIMPLIQRTRDERSPREWYWALMDYGSYLKKAVPNPSRKSSHYTVQKKFVGSDRQLRGRIIKALLEKNGSTAELSRKLGEEKERIERIAQQLLIEKLIHRIGRKYGIR